MPLRQSGRRQTLVRSLKRMLPALAGVIPSTLRTVVVLPMPLRPKSVARFARTDAQLYAKQHLASAVAGFSCSTSSK